jgi:L-seryl-tRNA(Ser) seleniumtransferase
MAAKHPEWLRDLPKVDKLLGSEELKALQTVLGVRLVTDWVREVVATAREAALQGKRRPDFAHCVKMVCRTAEVFLASRARPVINATGVVLHTNLGRAPLSRQAVDALAASAGGYTSIELDLKSGKRGKRGHYAARALASLTGAEDALVVNNNAAAVLLALTSLAHGRGVVVSRGEQVEIGGGFRVPEVLARSGCRMIEVGTTNRTRVADYARALDENDDVAVLLRVHPGNFKMSGFVERPSIADLADLAEERGVVLIHDLGGGALIDFVQHAGLHGEPVVRDCVAAGAHVVCFSCDKVLGGPQGGALVGARRWIDRVRRDPLARALRLGRLPLVALEATLAAYLAEDLEQLPALRAMGVAEEQVQRRVMAWCDELKGAGIAAETVSTQARAGGGALAEEPLASFAAWLKDVEPERFASQLRSSEPAVMPRIQNERLLLDGRSVIPGEDEALLAAVISAMRSSPVR